jgi:hypothetical protein
VLSLRTALRQLKAACGEELTLVSATRKIA